MALVLGPAELADSADDGAVVQDVLAFLDSFEQGGGGGSESPGTPTDNSGIESPRTSRPTEEVLDASMANRRRARAEASNIARVRRYHKKKGELDALRVQVASLTRRLELLARCASSTIQAQQTSALGVSIRRALGSRPLGWQKRARAEREMRERAERTNAQLRQLLLAHLHHAGSMQSEVTQASSDFDSSLSLLSGHDCAVAVQATRSPPKSLDAQAQEAMWSFVFRQLYLEACALVDLNSLDSIGTFVWADAPTKTWVEWTTSFSIPRNDPRSVGKKWWYDIQEHRFSPNSSVNLLTFSNGEVARLEKRTKWNLLGPDNREICVYCVTMFESHDKEGHWLVLAYSSIYDSTGSDLLFRATAAKVVIKPQSVSPRPCIVRTHYRVSVPVGERCSITDEKPTPRELAINAWASKMRSKDDHMKRSFIH